MALCKLVLAVLVVLVSAAVADSRSKSVRSSEGQTVQGYTFATDVSSLLGLEANLAELEKLVSVDKTPSDVYIDRMAQIVSDRFATLSTGSLGEPTYNLYAAYWRDPDYALAQVGQTLSAEGRYTSIKDLALSRRAGVVEALRYNVILHGVIHEVESAVKNCDQPGTARASWDRAAALYLGNGVDTGYSRSAVGRMLFKLSNELCRTARTCESDDGMYGDSVNNIQILKYLKEGAHAASTDDCESSANARKEVLRRLFVPSLQILIKYAYKLDPNKNAYFDMADRVRAQVHLSALMPQLAACDADKANILSDNFSLDASPYMKLGYLGVADLIAEFLPCLKFNCDDLGGYTGYYVAEIEKCIDPKSTFSNKVSENASVRAEKA